MPHVSEFLHTENDVSPPHYLPFRMQVLYLSSIINSCPYAIKNSSTPFNRKWMSPATFNISLQHIKYLLHQRTTCNTDTHTAVTVLRFYVSNTVIPLHNKGVSRCLATLLSLYSLPRLWIQPLEAALTNYQSFSLLVLLPRASNDQRLGQAHAANKKPSDSMQ